MAGEMIGSIAKNAIGSIMQLIGRVAKKPRSNTGSENGQNRRKLTYFALLLS